MYMRTMQQLRADPETITDLSEFTGEPVFITDRGETVLVVMSPSLYATLT